MLFVLILALLVLGGDQAFNSIVGLLNGAVGLTYVLSIGCVLWRRTFGEPLPPARWSLGKLGIPLNVIAVLYQSFATIISFFPLFAEVTAANFNWYVSMQGLGRRVSDESYLQGNCHVCVGDRHRSLKLLHHRKEDLRGTCRHDHQRCIEGKGVPCTYFIDRIRFERLDDSGRAIHTVDAFYYGRNSTFNKENS